MFRKLVSNLSFSPALVGQLGFYAKRLRREEATRRIGLIFTALALVVQSFAVFSPPESANAASSDSIIYQSLKNKSELLAVYDRNRDSAGHTDIQQIYKHYGVTRQDIVNAREGLVYTGSQGGKIKFTGRSNYGVSNRWAVKIPGTNSTIYTGAWQDQPYNVKAVYGQRAIDGKWFAIMLYCGNIMYVDEPPRLKPTAACTSLRATALSRDTFRIAAKSTTSDGAKIKSYNYVIKNSANREVVNRTINTSSTGSYIEHKLPDNDRYTASVVVDTTLGKRGGQNCITSISVAAAPIADCSALSINSISRTKFTFHARSTAANGATINGYTYIVKDNSGKEILRKYVSSSESNSKIDYNFERDGKYTVEVIVATSLGSKTNADCKKNLTVTPEERCPLNPDLVLSNPDCKPCVDDPTIWYKDDNCTAEFDLTKTVANLTQAKEDANGTTAKPGDVLQYTLTVKNTGKDEGQFTFEDDLTDTEEYADIKDLGGAKIEKAAELGAAARSIAKWEPISLKPGETATRTVNVQLKTTTPATAQHDSARQSYDCKITNVFGQTVSVGVECPPEKVVEAVVSELPKTGATANIIAAGVVMTIVTYFYARSRQLKTEVRLIRHDLNSGTI